MTMTDTETMCYVGFAPCGCGELFIVDTGLLQRETAREIGKAIRQGLTITRMTMEDARPLIVRCPHREPKRRKAAAPKQAGLTP